jgi:NADPH-dependent ferric siderophore reductase
MSHTLPAVSFPAARTYQVRVVDACVITPRMRRVRLAGPDLVGFTALPGQDVVVRLQTPAGPAHRRYTIRNLDPINGAFDLDIVLHGHGPGARWAAGVEPGAELEIFGPRGKVPLATAPAQVFVGDESALPAIAEMAAALPRATEIRAVIEVSDAAERQPMPPELDVRWLIRGDREPGTADLLLSAIDELSVAGATRHFYLFAESRVVRLLREALSARGVPLEEISAKGYWNKGRPMRG